jgi:hypothetical protein
MKWFDFLILLGVGFAFGNACAPIAMNLTACAIFAMAYVWVRRAAS